MKADFIEGETGFNEMVDKILAIIAERKVMVTAIDLHIEQVGERKGRLKKQIELLEASLLAGTLAIDEKKLERPLCTVSQVREKLVVEITEESALPSWAFVDQKPKLDKKLVNERAKDLVDIEELANGERIIKLKKGVKPIPGAVVKWSTKSLQMRWK